MTDARQRAVAGLLAADPTSWAGRLAAAATGETYRPWYHRSREAVPFDRVALQPDQLEQPGRASDEPTMRLDLPMNAPPRPGPLPRGRYLGHERQAIRATAAEATPAAAHDVVVAPDVEARVRRALLRPRGSGDLEPEEKAKIEALLREARHHLRAVATVRGTRQAAWSHAELLENLEDIVRRHAPASRPPGPGKGPASAVPKKVAQRLLQGVLGTGQRTRQSDGSAVVQKIQEFALEAARGEREKLRRGDARWASTLPNCEEGQKPYTESLSPSCLELGKLFCDEVGLSSGECRAVVERVQEQLAYVLAGAAALNRASFSARTLDAFLAALAAVPVGAAGETARRLRDRG